MAGYSTYIYRKIRMGFEKSMMDVSDKRA